MASAKRVANEDMQRRGVQPDQRIHDTLKLPAADLNRMRTSKLNLWLKEGRVDATAAAWKLFNQLVARGVVDVFHCNVMLRQACHDSTHMKVFMDNDMQNAGVTPNVNTYNTYVRQLVREGNVIEARRVVDEETKSKGMEFNQRMKLNQRIDHWCK